jgi:hypothetical protein
MLSYWKDEKAPDWLASKKDVFRREYAFTEEQEQAFRELLDEELGAGIVVLVPHTYPRFLNSVFMVPKKGGKWRKVVECRTINVQQFFTHFRMNGPEVVQVIALSGNWATALDINSAFQPHEGQPGVPTIPVLRTARQVLCLQLDAVWVPAQPMSVYESIVLRVGRRTDVLEGTDRCLHGQHSYPAPRSIVSRAREVADCNLPAEFMLDLLNGKLGVYAHPEPDLPRLATELPATDTEDGLGDALHAVVHARPVDSPSPEGRASEITST